MIVDLVNDVYVCVVIVGGGVIGVELVVEFYNVVDVLGFYGLEVFDLS